MKRNTSSDFLSAEFRVTDFGIHAISDVILFCRPERTSPVDPEAPRMILLFAFYNAPTHTLYKDYISKHMEKWPSTSIIVIRSLASWLIRSQNEKDSLLLPAIEILLEEVYESSDYKGRLNGLLIHLMSNGGGFMFTSFMDFLERVLVSRNQGHKSWTLPELATHEVQKVSFVPLAIILDSCPGFGGIRWRGSAFVASIKSPLPKSVALVPATIAFSTLLGTLYLFGAPQPFSTMHARLLSNSIVPGLSDYLTPRLYVYSEGDEIVEYRDVEAHIRYLGEALDADQRRRSEFRGFIGSSNPIMVEKFGLDSPHVMHARTDPARYWTAIGTLWKEAVKRPLAKAKL